MMQRQVQQCRRGIRPSVVGARSAIEQCDFAKPLRRFGEPNDRSLAQRRDGAEGDSAEINAIKAITWVAAMEYVFAGRNTIMRDDASTAC